MKACETPRIGVLLANTGTPKSPEPRDVRRYLGRFLMDERIRPMAKAPWWLILHLFILPTRSVKSGRKYGKIWTEAGSPFDVEHAKLRDLLEQRLQGDGMDVRVQVGQSYGEDSIRTALAALREQGCTQVVVLPLYPQSAHSTTLSVKDGVAAAMTELSWQASVAFVDSYGMDSAYIPMSLRPAQPRWRWRVAFVLIERSGPSATIAGSIKAANGCSRLPEAFSSVGRRREMAVSSWFARILR